MSKILITSDEYSIYGNGQRNLIKTSSGKLLLFYVYGTSGSWRYNLGYKVSSDDGINWSSVTDALALLTTDSITGFTVLIESNDDILIFYTQHNGNGIPDYLYHIKFVKLTYNSGTWIVGTPVEITSRTDEVVSLSMAKRTNGDIFIGAGDSDIRDLIIYYSNNEGTSWNDISISPSAQGGYVNPTISLIPKGDNIGLITKRWEFGNDYCYLDYLEWDTSWSVATHIAEEYQDYANVGLQSIIKISDTNIWAVTHEADIGIKIYHYNGSSWDSGTILFDNNEWYNSGWDNGCVSLCNVGGNPVLVCSYIDIDYNINTRYRYYNGSSWESEVILSDSNNSWSCNTLEYDSSALYVCFQDSIYFQKIILVIPPPEIIESDNLYLLDDLFTGGEVDSLTLSDEIELNVSLEKQELNDSISLSDLIELELQETYDLINDFHLVKQYLLNINNKFNSVRQFLTNINNLCLTAHGYILNIVQKINTKRQELYNIKNDIRLLASFQIPGDAGAQSLGKSYITVKINNILQEDVDIDSITINKIVDTSHTASFELGRAYDATKPALESSVEIKYHIWTLYKGYITQIVPADNPENIKIQCQDEYWKKNQEKVYFNIGHKPSSDTELYYNTIAEGLSILGTPFSIGGFIPQTVGLFGSPKSDAITNLVNESGNFSWYYNPDGTMKLWIAGSGDIINIERQEIGKNLGLYQVLSHSIKEDAESLVNKFRVQMGQQVIKRFTSNGASQAYASYSSEYFPFTPQPNWNSGLETLAKESNSGYGWDFHPTTEDSLYEKVFKEYQLSFGGNLNAQFEGWSDEFAPKVEINNSGSMMGWECSVPEGRLKTGFTIDYENNLLTFSEPIFCFKKNIYGEVTAVRRPQVYVCLYKRKYYNRTSSSGDDPTQDITNPLMFFTSVMGTYPVTIMNNLNLTNLGIQVGGWYREDEFTWRLVPSWNDTEFAQDYANWQLSQNCDKKYSGTIDITLDAFCYYGIELNKRIMINNILDSALNIDSIILKVSSFTVSISLKSARYFARTVSVQSRGE